MSKLILNAELLERLPTVTAETMIVNEQEIILGTFLPIALSKTQLDIGATDLPHAEPSSSWSTTPDVYAYLENQ